MLAHFTCKVEFHVTMVQRSLNVLSLQSTISLQIKKLKNPSYMHMNSQEVGESWPQPLFALHDTLKKNLNQSHP